MATYNVTTATTRGRVTVINTVAGVPAGGEWLDNRDNFPLNVPTVSVNSNDAAAVSASWGSSGGGNRSTCSRYYMAFNTSSVPVQANAITLWVYAGSSVSSDIMVVQADAPTTTTNVNGSNYKAIPGYVNGDTMSGNVIDFIDGGPIFLTAGWNAITLNANAASAWNSTSTWQLALVNGSYDYAYSEPSWPSIINTGISAASFPPYAVITTGVEQWVVSLNPTVTKKVNPVSESNVYLVNRVGAYTFYRSTTGGANNVSNSGCSLPFPGTTPLYCDKPFSSIAIGDYVYTDYALSIPFNGGSLYFTLWYSVGSMAFDGSLYQISAAGQITDINVGGCAF